MLLGLPVVTWIFASIILIAAYLLLSFHRVGPSEVGLVLKRFSARKLSGDNIIAFQGEAGYQADLLLPGMRWMPWLLYEVQKFPWVQIPAGEIGVVIAQVGSSLPIGAKSAVYKKSFGNFADLRSFITGGGQKGVQRPVFSPGTLAPIHPVGFLVVTKSQAYGLPISPELRSRAGKVGRLGPEAFGLQPNQLELLRIEPRPCGKDGALTDMVGIVTTYEGDPLPSGDIASRLGGFADIDKMEKDKATDGDVIEVLLGNKNNLHNNYQDFQAFVDNGGKIGLQHDPLLYGAYALNPFLVGVEMVGMLVVQQGQVAVIKAYVGLPTQDTSGTDFKFGSLVRPGHRGIWEEPLRTGKYPLNPRCYQAEIVPTSILTLNWADAVSQAHNLDAQLSQIVAKSSEGFVFRIDLQVQIHVPDTNAPRVISMVGTMINLVNEVLQAAVGNHFRDKLQSMPPFASSKLGNKSRKRPSNTLKNSSTSTASKRAVYISKTSFFRKTSSRSSPSARSPTRKLTPTASSAPRKMNASPWKTPRAPRKCRPISPSPRSGWTSRPITPMRAPRKPAVKLNSFVRPVPPAAPRSRRLDSRAPAATKRRYARSVPTPQRSSTSFPRSRRALRSSSRTSWSPAVRTEAAHWMAWRLLRCVTSRGTAETELQRPPPNLPIRKAARCPAPQPESQARIKPCGVVRSETGATARSSVVQRPAKIAN